MDPAGARIDILAAATLLQAAAEKLKPDPLPLFADGFEDLPISRWAAGTVHGAWKAVWGSQGIEQAGTGKALGQITKVESGRGFSTLTTSLPKFADIDLTLKMTTLKQTWATPRPYHVAWIAWRCDADFSNGYYLVLKPVGPQLPYGGWELGRTRDVGGEEQVFLATGHQYGAYPIGRQYAVRVRHVGAVIECWADGKQLVRYEERDVPPPPGSIGLYCEDSRVQFDDVRVMAP